MSDPQANWRLSDGEEAHLTPEGAVIESHGTLPFRVRTEGQSYLRPPFPGTAVRLGEEHYEVVAEEEARDTVTYRLRPWPPDHIARDVIAYDRRLILAVQRERREAEQRERARIYSWLLYPVVGLLPEARQLQACDRYGLHPAMATLASGAVELLAAIALGRAVGPKVLALPVLLGLVLPGSGRILFALVFREVSGWWVLVAAERWAGGLMKRPRRLDASVLPITRDAFWARLAQADRHETEEGGMVLVTSTLAHLTWRGGRRLQTTSGDWWMAAVLPPTAERGRLFYRYRLTPLLDPDARDARTPEPPSPRAYQDEVAERIAREWDDFLFAGAWLASLLPAAVQQRAFGPRGGPALIAAKAKLTAALEIAAGLYLIGSGLLWTGLTPMDAVSAGFVVEGGMRFAQASRREYAPSVLGLAFADLLRPERVAYHVHRDTERETLASLGAATGSSP